MTGLSRAATRNALASERERTEAGIAALQRDFDAIVSSASASADDEHDPEGTSSAFDRQHVAALLGQAQDQLAALARAEQRLAVFAPGAPPPDPLPSARADR